MSQTQADILYMGTFQKQILYSSCFYSLCDSTAHFCFLLNKPSLLYIECAQSHRVKHSSTEHTKVVLGNTVDITSSEPDVQPGV